MSTIVANLSSPDHVKYKKTARTVLELVQTLWEDILAGFDVHVMIEQPSLQGGALGPEVCIQSAPEALLQQVLASQEMLLYPGSLRISMPWTPQFSDSSQGYLLGSLKELVWDRETWEADIRQFSNVWLKNSVDFWVEGCLISKRDPWTVLWFIEHLLVSQSRSYEDRYSAVLAAGQDIYQDKFGEQCSQPAELSQAELRLVDFFLRATGREEIELLTAEEIMLQKLFSTLGIGKLIVSGRISSVGIHLY